MFGDWGWRKKGENGLIKATKQVTWHDLTSICYKLDGELDLTCSECQVSCLVAFISWDAHPQFTI